MSNLEEIKIELRGIASILKDKNSYVPKYQRSYAWRDENVEHFLQDIGSAIHNGSSEYFLGSVVISERDEGRPEIVDGQQRLATAVILLSAIRDYFFVLGTDEGKERAQMIFNEYLAKKDLDTLELLPKLNMNESDHDYFLRKVISNPGTPERDFASSKKSHVRIDKAVEIAKKHVKHISGITSEPTKLLVQWINFLKDKAKVIAVRVPDESNAFTIFETLNDRGLALAVSDLLKNYLFYKSEDRITEVQYKWVQVVSSIESVEDEQAIISFIRYFWSSKYGLVREKELFERIKKNITSKSEAVSLTNGLYEACRLYSAMISCDDNFWAAYSSSSKISMQTINFFKMIQMRPLILSILENFDAGEIEKSLRLLVNVSARLLIVGGLGSGALEQKYCDAAVRINKNDILSAKQLSVFLSSISPTDSEFKSAFQSATVSKNYLARYYLRTLEMVKHGNKEPEFVPNVSNDVVTLEHILPQNPSHNWGHIDPDDAKSHYKRIGNLVLLSKSINSDIGNECFDVKKPYLGKSDYELTSSVSKYPKWGLAEISARQEELSDLAVIAWPI